MITRTSEGVKTALNHIGAKLRYNVRSGQAEVLWKNNVWEDFKDNTECNILDAIEKQCAFWNPRGKEIGPGQPRGTPASFGETTWNRYIGSILFENEVDPFKDYLESLPPWDGVDRLSKMFHTCIMAEDTELNAATGPGLAYRCYRPYLQSGLQARLDPGAYWRTGLRQVHVSASPRGP